MKAISVLVAFLLLGLIIPTKVLGARDIVISSDKSSLFGEEYTTITASASGFTNGEVIYIKGAFHQDGSTNYFGYTKNGDNWIKNGESTSSQLSITVGNWDNKLIVKSDFSDSGFNGEGSYKLRVGFYYTTSGGNLSSVNWSSNSLDITLNQPDPTPTLTLTPTPTSTNTPTPTIIITNTPTITKLISKTPTPTSSKTSPTKKEEVLADATVDTNNSVGKPIDKNKTDNAKPNINFLPIIFISIGIVFLILCVIVILYPYIKGHIAKKNEQ